MKVSSELSWMMPYLEIAKNFVDTSQLTEVYHTRCSKCLTKKNRYMGQCTMMEDDTYIIGVYIDWIHVVSMTKPKYKIHKYTRIEMLMILAHELAHLKYWDHCPQRQILESEMTIAFMFQLESEGYISEEKSESKRLS